MPDAGANKCEGAGAAWYSYAVIRVVPRVERGEFMNVGIILFARTLGFLEARIEADEARLGAISLESDPQKLQNHLDTFQAIAAGEPAGGPIARLSQSERFHWLTSPRSTMIQTSPVHAGRCDDPAAVIEELMDELVR
jgi:hypothetical protein